MTGVGAGTQVRGGGKRTGGYCSWTGEDGVRLLANIGVRTFPANQTCSHLSPRKSTVEPKVAFPTLAGLPGPAPTSSSSGYSNPGLWGSLCTSSPLSAVGGGSGSLDCRAPFPPGSRLTPGQGGSPSTAHLGTAAARARSPPELRKPAASPGSGVSVPPQPTHTSSAFVAVSPRIPPLCLRLMSWGLGRERGSGGARTHAGSPEPGVGRREPSREPRGLLLQKGEENGEELGGRLSGKEGS